MFIYFLSILAILNITIGFINFNKSGRHVRAINCSNWFASGWMLAFILQEVAK